MDWKPYRDCCRRYAAEVDAGFCPECGHPFLRCMAFSECHSLVTPTQACPVCVAPQLMIDAGAVVQSKAGERVSVPLILRNCSSSRTIWVKEIIKLDAQAGEPIILTWEQIDPQTERHFVIETPPLAEGGQHTLRMLVVLSSRYRGLEETYAFTGATTITVSTPESQQVIQNINLSGAQFQTGGMVHTALNTKDRSRSEPTALADRTALQLDRAERYELENGIRGYRSEGLRVPRNIEFSFNGFSRDDVPPDGSTMMATGRFAFGRNSRAPHASANTVPMDISLRAYDRSGQIDTPATMAISRHHFDLVVVNDRLCVQVRASNGVELTGTALQSGGVAVLSPRDSLVPIPGHQDRLAISVAFSSSLDAVERITVKRAPGVVS